MIKTKKITTTQEEVVTTDILCNLCGKTCKLGNSDDRMNRGKLVSGKNPKNNIFGGLLEIEVHGGYESTHLSDMSITRFSICELCITKLTKKFKIPADVKESYTAGFVPENQLKKHYQQYEKNMNKLYAKKNLK
jgi:hypothetical protein